MARRRFQDPRPSRRGRYWWLLIRQDEIVDGQRIRKRKRVKLAPAEMPEREVRKIAAETLRPLNQGLVTIGSAMKFEDYVEQEYKATILPTFAGQTQERYEGIIRNYLSPAFGPLALRDLTHRRIQKYFSSMANSPLSHESKDKIRDVLSSILGSAMPELLVTNPVEGVRLPPSKKGKRGKPHVTPEQFHKLVQLIPEPYASMTYVAVYAGLRVSELIGLRWKNVHEDSITIDERYCRGEWGPPKSDASNATIAVNHSVVERIQRLKTLTVDVRAGRGAVRHYRVVKSSGPDDLVFQSVTKGGPMRDNNILVRFIKPAARSLGIGWVNWRCLRTSHATWLKMAGADVKDAQAQMRHSRASTTLDIYQQFVPASQRQAVERLSSLPVGSLVN
ncbi:MAG TPA: tyrosine-type recombinase/integrase [Candidatus Cybelea sp.]|nr:tyrosine-type recombinase/integrase [Candidatus Cybelea sp.]